MADRTFLDLTDEVLDHGFDPTIYRPRVKRWLNDGVRRLKRRLEIADNQAEGTQILSVGLAAYALPTNFVRLAREDTRGSMRIVVDGAADVMLVEVGLRALDELDESRTGTPDRFALDGDEYILWPVPDAADTLKLRYWSGASEMSGDGDLPGIPDEYAELAVSYALSRAYKSEDDPEMATFHFGEWERDTQRMGVDLQGRSKGPAQVPGMLGIWGDTDDETPGRF